MPTDPDPASDPNQPSSALRQVLAAASAPASTKLQEVMAAVGARASRSAAEAITAPAAASIAAASGSAGAQGLAATLLAGLPTMPDMDAMVRRSASVSELLSRSASDRLRHQANVEQATLNVATTTSDLVKVARAQHDLINALVVAVDALVGAAQVAATTEKRRFRVTLPVFLITMAAAIVAAAAAVVLILR
jgi:hypothetical protein